MQNNLLHFKIHSYLLGLMTKKMSPGVKTKLCLILEEENQFLGLMNDETGEDEAEVVVIVAGDTAS